MVRIAGAVVRNLVAVVFKLFFDLRCVILSIKIIDVFLPNDFIFDILLGSTIISRYPFLNITFY